MEHDEGLGIGVFAFDNAPVPHPFCRCNWYATEGDRSLEDIARELGRWEEGESNPLLDQAFGEWRGLDNSAASGIMNTADVRGMANGLRKAPLEPLSEEQIASLKEDIRAIGADESVFDFNTGRQTGFSDKTGKIKVRNDVYPDLESTIPRDRLSTRAVLAHEYYGHYAHRGTTLAKGSWNDEFRASYQAAVKAPGLTDEDRMNLMRDAQDRAREAGFQILNSTMRRLIYGY